MLKTEHGTTDISVDNIKEAFVELSELSAAVLTLTIDMGISQKEAYILLDAMCDTTKSAYEKGLIT